jgi:UbiD family decarboxylase
VPADAEYVLEGYLDNKGHVEPEGPFGEYVGYYGIVKRNPVFHLTAITRRKDALFQTVTIGGKHLARTDTAQLTTVKTESAAWAGLVTAVREPVAVFATPSSGGMYNVRVSLRQRVPGEARNATPRCSAHAEASRCSCSTTTSTCSPTNRPIGRWRHGSRPTATSSSRAGSARCRSIGCCCRARRR